MSKAFFQFFDPERECEPHAIPDVEIFYVGDDDMDDAERLDSVSLYLIPRSEVQGWYWQACQPGCLPDSEPVGPFKSSELALLAAQDF